MPSQREVLILYKQLLRYGQQLHLTDKAYFQQRITSEFKKNKVLEDKEDITFNFKVTYILLKRRRALTPWAGAIVMALPVTCVRRAIKPNFFTTLSVLYCEKHTIDYSLVPKILESDLDEKFIRGSGPGGSNVNKNSNCVMLTHKPSGIVIKCHDSRLLHRNRVTARVLLITKLDDINNRERSVSAQMKAIEKKSSTEQDRRRTKLDHLKASWRKREGLD